MSESQDQPWTVLRLLDWTTDFFKRKGSESPRLDAEVLLAHARDCERIELYTAFAEEPEEEQRVAFREMVRRRGEGMPVAQLVGYREFYSSRFRVNDATLIPRPETEHLVVETLDCAKQFSLNRPLQIIDVGTGSGVIAISVAQSCENAVVTAVDISAAALKIATWNAQKLEVADRIKFMQSDLLTAVEQPERFDMICSNPPYVSEAEYKALSPTVRDFEPRGALVSGPEGTEVIAQLLEQTPDRLQIGGRLIIELSPMIADACQALALANSAFGDLRFIKDLDGHRRILSLQRT
ncbi:MAG: protein-(glutamine-N5) methyltransferase, release factor-specific [Planctomycetaceae bacterium TMED240]|nr:protein-(glutamine-N5) methyltransferase, release factor-specific [Rhodopirellula sp.]OUX05405.1 MAG: protein-(glutamine-N5) methyltransferase, release factor-specific [Planctomycetaceae bacterium TMED240]